MSEELYLYLGFSLIKLFVHCLMLELVKNIFFFVGEELNHRKLIHQYHLESQNLEKYTPSQWFLPRVGLSYICTFRGRGVSGRGWIRYSLLRSPSSWFQGYMGVRGVLPLYSGAQDTVQTSNKILFSAQDPIILMRIRILDPHREKMDPDPGYFF